MIRIWIYLALWLVWLPVGILVQHRNPQVMKARAGWRLKDILLSLQPLIFVGLTIHQRSLYFRWTYLGVSLYCAGISLITWVLLINPYAESEVRIQSERGQIVVLAGPYRIVRHPLYVGSILTYVGIALILGSFLVLGLLVIIVLFFIRRTVFEDRLLRRELAGYEQYASRTRYRLIPFVW